MNGPNDNYSISSIQSDFEDSDADPNFTMPSKKPTQRYMISSSSSDNSGDIVDPESDQENTLPNSSEENKDNNS
ncbi:hypothetical protein ABEB36_007772 [Hypothenemus hampei]|uniref:Uncharacterized protein n=1 Tax=Hypothenemus hampei TaxID=57062 RepID=A0ABD1EVQ3_HYPHA